MVVRDRANGANGRPGPRLPAAGPASADTPRARRPARIVERAASAASANISPAGRPVASATLETSSNSGLARSRHWERRSPYRDAVPEHADRPARAAAAPGAPAPAGGPRSWWLLPAATVSSRSASSGLASTSIRIPGRPFFIVGGHSSTTSSAPAARSIRRQPAATYSAAMSSMSAASTPPSRGPDVLAVRARASVGKPRWIARIRRSALARPRKSLVPAPYPLRRDHECPRAAARREHRTSAAPVGVTNSPEPAGPGRTA